MFSIDQKHFLTGEELSAKELMDLLERAEELKQQPQNESLKNRHVALIFEKPSLRTRVSFTVGIQQMGGQIVELQGSQKKSEEPEDSIRVLQGMVQAVMLRTFEHSNLERMASVSRIPIINGLSDLHHPCQALADLLTLKQRFQSLQGLKLAYIGDGNNVLHSLLLLLPYAGVDVHYSTPIGFEPDSEILQRARARAKIMGTQIISFSAPREAVKNVDAIYTDVWTSMGFESENQKRQTAFQGYQLNMELFNLAKPEAIALHCLPMLRGQEITSEVADHTRSALFDQAENRLHAQKALLERLLSPLNNKLQEQIHPVRSYDFTN